MLLNRGADPNSECGYLLTPFYSAFCMGHGTAAGMLLSAGADTYPPRGLFRNIWDSDELRKLVQNSEKYTNMLKRIHRRIHPLLYLEAAAQFENMGQRSSAEEMNRRAQR